MNAPIGELLNLAHSNRLYQATDEGAFFLIRSELLDHEPLMTQLPETQVQAEACVRIANHVFSRAMDEAQRVVARALVGQP